MGTVTEHGVLKRRMECLQQKLASIEHFGNVRTIL